MARRFPFKAALAFAAIVCLMLFSLGIVEGDPAAQPAASSKLTATVGEALAFTLSTDEVTPGDNVTLTIVQTSNDVDHTFTLSSVAGLTFSPSNSTSDLVRFIADHPPVVDVKIPAGTTTFTTYFIAPPFGLYAYFCLTPGHFPAMYGILGSGEHGSTAAPYDGPGAPVFIIGGTIAGLVVVALVLGFVIGRRRGSHDEMSPERLGYSEVPGAPRPPAH